MDQEQEDEKVALQEEFKEVISTSNPGSHDEGDDEDAAHGRRRPF